MSLLRLGAGIPLPHTVTVMVQCGCVGRGVVCTGHTRTVRMLSSLLVQLRVCELSDLISIPDLHGVERSLQWREIL